ncbi:hypothetical protein J6590_032231 [Homalodisca vitripennis]|nr:hypothetical protein J6590_032231 [Homalodisca vitripennis]
MDSAVQRRAPRRMDRLNMQLNINAGDVSWRGPAPPGKTRRFKIRLKRLTADGSGTTVCKYAVPRSLSLSHRLTIRRDIRCKLAPALLSFELGANSSELFRAQVELRAVSSELVCAFSFYLVYRFFSRPLGRLPYVGTSNSHPKAIAEAFPLFPFVSESAMMNAC